MGVNYPLRTLRETRALLPTEAHVCGVGEGGYCICGGYIDGRRSECRGVYGYVFVFLHGDRARKPNLRRNQYPSHIRDITFIYIGESALKHVRSCLKIVPNNTIIIPWWELIEKQYSVDSFLTIHFCAQAVLQVKWRSVCFKAKAQLILTQFTRAFFFVTYVLILLQIK